MVYWQCVVTDQSEDNGYVPGTANRLWRLEQRQQDVLRRLDKLEQKAQDIAERQDERRWRLDAAEARVGSIEARIAALEKRPEGSPMLGEYSAIVRFALYLAAALVVALVSGQALNLSGLFK